MTTPIEILQLEKAWGLKFTRLNEEEFRTLRNQFYFYKVFYYVTNHTNQIWGIVIPDSQIIGINELTKLAQLKELHLRSNKITDITELAKLSRLVHLNLGNNQISNVKPLAKLTQLATLELGYNQITDTKELAKLKQLVNLDLSYNQITDVEDLKHLSHLVILDLSYNQITDVEELIHLAKLEKLNIRGNQITNVKPLAKLAQLATLELGYNQITDTKGLDQFKQLVNLDLNENKISNIKGLAQLSKLKKLKLSGNHISEIKELSKLFHLNELDLSDNEITDITALTHLTQLRELDLSSNQITDIKELAQLSQLVSLSLNSNQITDIKGLANLYQLKTLDISHNQVTDIKELGQLSQLVNLYLIDNQISDIKELVSLHQLKELNLCNNQITDVKSLAKLFQLKELDLSSNKITDVKELANLYQLEELNLCSNGFTDVKELAKLSQLKVLNLSDNCIVEVKDLAKLSQLTELELCDNHLRDIDQLESICELKYLKKVDFSGNPELPLEQEIITDIDKLRARFKDSKQGTTPHRNVKLLFLGDGCAGKSTLYSHLKEGKATHIDIHDRTDGIALNSWQNALPNVTVNVWDFGGQDIFHGTHRLFLGQRAIYVLLYTKTELKHCSQDDTHPLRYWLDFIADYGKGSRVLLVENVINDEFHSHFPDDFTLTELVKRYKQKGIYLDTSQYRFDCKHDTTGVNKFKNVLETEIETLLEQYPIQDYPLSWHLVQSALEKKKQTQSTLSMTKYDQLCNQHQISNPLALLEYFSQTGVVSYYKDLYQDKIILQTHWVLNAVYKAISIKDPNPLKSTNGKLNDDDFQKIWQDYSTEEQALFKSYLLKSGLMTELRSNYHPYPKKIIRPYRYLMPSLFSKVKTADKIIWTEKQRYFSIEFPFMYGAIIQRLQVAILAHCHQEEEESFYQNYISLVDHNHCRGTVEVVENEMKIWAETAELYGKIFHELNEIYPLERTTIYENQQTQRKKIEYSKQQIGTISIAQGFTQQPLFMINFTKTANYLSLVDKLKQNKAVFFLGTGVSAYTTQNASLATWKGLLTHGIDYCQSIPIQGCDQDWVNSKKKDLSRDDIEEWLSVAAILTSKLETNTHFKTWLRKSVGSLQPLRKELIEEIGKLNAPIFTTNYDNLIEDILKYPHITNRQSDKIQEVLNDNRKAVVHLHGHYDDAESVILGIRSYQDLTNNTFFQELEKAISLSKHIVYVGYGAGLEDPNFGKLLKWSKQNIDSEHHQYRLVLEKDASSFTQDRKIQNIVYGKTYDDILTFFQELNRDIS